MTPEQAAALRAPFPASAIGKLPKAGTTLDYVGHAAVTDRLLEVDPEWNWEPFALAADGSPFFNIDNGDAVMWIRLTVCGVTRLGVGIVKATAGELEKQLISDALRNAAMRFGVALDLWSKEALHEEPDDRPKPATPERIARLTMAVKAAEIGDWVKDQGFPWPWTDTACDVIKAKLDAMVSA